MSNVQDYANLGGWVNEPKEVNVAMMDLPIPSIETALSEIKDSGKNKTVLLYKYIKEIHPNFEQVQQQPDCLNPSALVRMADYSEKPIKDVETGDMVITPYGNIKTVTNIIKKPYNEHMIKIKTQSFNVDIETTPNHLYMTLPNIGRGKKGNKNLIEWKRADQLTTNDYLLIPKLPNNENDVKYDLKNLGYDVVLHDSDFKKLRTDKVELNKIRLKGSKFSVNRYINLDERLCWLIGLFSAEGSSHYKNGKYKDIVFNLGSDELHLALKIKSYIKEIFDFECSIVSDKNKPSCLFVYINNVLIASLFKSLCYGNVYNKKLNNSLLATSYNNKLSLLCGWLDGDGCNGRSGVSVSNDLIHDYFNICNSLDINANIVTRKPYKQSKQSYTLNSSTIINSDTINSLKIKCIKRINIGKAVKIKEITHTTPETNYVYCIEVPDDNSFICNGYGIHNCTSFASSHVVDILKAIEIVKLGQFEDFVNITSTEFTYGASRVLIGGGRLGNGGGSLGVWTAKSVVDYGTLVRKKYDEIDLTNYSGKLALDWGYNGPTRSLLKISKETYVKNISQVTTYASARDALANGYPIVVCSNVGFGNKRDKYGMLYPSGNWAHAMAVIAVDDAHKIPSVLILNSWPESWVSGPQRFGDEPKGSFWCPYDVFETMLMQNDSFVYSDFNGFPVKELDLRWV